MKRSDLEKSIIGWAGDRNLLSNDNAKNQVLKCMSELGELADAILKDEPDAIVDGIGDVEVTLIILKEQLGMSQDLPLLSAWNEIKNRTGKTVNGTFIKD